METSMTDGTFSGEPNTFKVLLGKMKHDFRGIGTFVGNAGNFLPQDTSQTILWELTCGFCSCLKYMN
jgi:hypothetical protein